MRVAFTKAFEKDISKIESYKVAQQVIDIIEQLKVSESLSEIQNIKKMKGSNNAFRIKVKDFRVGFYLIGNQILLTRVLNRKDIYKYFPEK